MAYKSHRASNCIVSTFKGNVKRKSYFQSAADEANAALTHDLVSRFVLLEQEINHLEHYMAFLEPRQAEVIRLAYFEGHTWQQISAKTQITTRTLYKLRNQAVEELVEMYALTADLQR